MPNTKAIGVAYSDPLFDSIGVAGGLSTVSITSPGTVIGDTFVSTAPSGKVVGNSTAGMYFLNSAITANSTVTTAPVGSLATTSNTTGTGTIFVSDGSKWQTAQAVNPYAAYITMLLKGDDLSDTIAGNTVVKGLNGTSTVAIDTSDKPFGTGSISFPGSMSAPDYGYLTNTRASGGFLGAGDFTIGFWIKTTATNGLIIGKNSAWPAAANLYLSGGSLYWVVGTTGQVVLTAGDVTTYFRTGTWNYCEFNRISGVCKLWIGGTQRGNNVNDAADYSNVGSVFIGGRADTGATLCRTKDMFILNGLANHTADFTPPTTYFPYP